MRFTFNSIISHWRNQKSDIKLIDLKALYTLSVLSSPSSIATLKSYAIYFIIY